MIEVFFPQALPPETGSSFPRHATPTGPDFGQLLNNESMANDRTMAEVVTTGNPVAVGETLELPVTLPTVELQVISASGHSMSFALPWRLIANGVLSQVSNHAAYSSGVTVNGPGQAVVSKSAPLSTHPAPAVSIGRASERVTGERIYPLGTANTNAATPDITSSEVIDWLMEGQAGKSGAESELWPARLLRLLMRPGDAGEELWIRDYLSNEPELSRVVDEVRAFLRQHGRMLERVIVNGKSLWTGENRWTRREAHGD
ncbi:hypothetical protein [Solilutibacter pythonis]|uniref:hypothetical protein n=1 Tax=Solilutibacter pythonis TaxID=2483112 RepID=UPI0011C40C30|nr:hypothetical protein [Lysobacter pythonis]